MSMHISGLEEKLKDLTQNIALEREKEFREKENGEKKS